MLQAPAIYGLQLLLNPCQCIHILTLYQVMIFSQQCACFFQAAGYHIVDSELVSLGQGLLQPRQARAGAQPALSGVQCGLAGEDFKQGGFAGAVAPQQAQFVAAGDRQVDLVQQHMSTEVQAGFIEF